MPALIALPLCLLGGCSHDTGVYPSLAARPVEKLGFAEPEVAVEPARPDPALDARIAALARQSDTLARGFSADAARAQSAATRAKGQPVGSEAWLDAQSALATLDDWRAQATSLLTDLDQLGSDRAAALLPPYPALTELRGRIAEQGARDDATIRRLQAALPSA